MGTAVTADGGLASALSAGSLGAGATATPVEFRSLTPLARWDTANVVRGRANGTVSAYAYCRLGDITVEQFRGLAQIQRDFGVEVRITNRQNFVLRGLTEEQLPELFDRLDALGMAEAGAELARDVVSCPGADTCNLAVTQSRGLAADIGDALEKAGLAEVGGVRINISGCTNSCGQHHIADIGFVGIERRAHGRAAPGYHMMLGGRVGNMEIEFGEKSVKLPAKRVSRGGGARGRAVRRRARRRRDLLRLAHPRGRRQGGLADARRPRRLPHARGGARLLRRLRRDRPLRRRSRRQRVRDMTRSLSATGDTPVAAVRSLASTLRSCVAPGAAEDEDFLPHVSTVPDLGELARVSGELETQPASEAVRWAWETFKDEVVLAASFQDCVLIDVAMQVAPDIEVVFLDTQYHFAETLWYVEQVRERYDLNLRVITPQIDPDNLWQVDPDACCEMRKVEPLARALEGKAAWLTGLRRDEAPTRANCADRRLGHRARDREGQPARTVVARRHRRLRRDRGLPQHPLRDKGYPSIGCWPCTQPVAEGDDPRAGRWAGTGKLECGLHGWTPSLPT